MPLPDKADQQWPPKSARDTAPVYDRWGAWYSGDVAALARVYSSAIGYGVSHIDAESRRGLMGAQERRFHGQTPGPGSLKMTKLHIPLASDIATTSADLLFAEPPALIVPDDAQQRGRSTDKAGAAASPTQKRLDDLMGWGMHAVLLEAAELASAYGGVYLRLGWDAKVADHVLLDAIPPDAAVPEFRAGHLVAVTFWRKLRNDADDGKVWRHLERHEPGSIEHGLYCTADDTRLGKRCKLSEHEETQAFGSLADGSGRLDTGAKGLTADYVPNMRPNRTLRGSALGRSDFDGIEPLMDALDEAWSSWMRDLRLGKAKLLLPEHYLESQGRGQGSVYDAEQEVYVQVNAMPGRDSGVAGAIQQVQFAIRVDEHSRTCEAITGEAVRGAGYSAQTFGMEGEVAVTATEVTAKQRRSFTTRAKKINYWRPVLARLLQTALEIDRKVFGSKVEPIVPDVEWPDGVADDPEATARTLQLLDAAKAVSTRTKVEMLHPDWDDDRVAEEVKLIDGAGMPDDADSIGFPGTAAAGTPPRPGTPAPPNAATGARPGVRPGGGEPTPRTGDTAGKAAPGGPNPAAPAARLPFGRAKAGAGR